MAVVQEHRLSFPEYYAPASYQFHEVFIAMERRKPSIKAHLEHISGISGRHVGFCKAGNLSAIASGVLEDALSP